MKVIPAYMVQRYLDWLDHAHNISRKDSSGLRKYDARQMRGAWAKVHRARQEMLAYTADATLHPDGPICTWPKDWNGAQDEAALVDQEEQGDDCRNNGIP